MKKNVYFVYWSFCYILYLTPICDQNLKLKNGIIFGVCLKLYPKRDQERNYNL